MATFDILELNKIGYDIDGKIMQIPDAESIVTTQQLTIGSTSVLTSAFSTTTRAVRLYAQTACRLEFGSSTVTAASTSPGFPGDGVEFWAVSPGKYLAMVSS